MTLYPQPTQIFLKNAPLKIGIYFPVNRCRHYHFPSNLVFSKLFNYLLFFFVKITYRSHMFHEVAEIVYEIRSNCCFKCGTSKALLQGTDTGLTTQLGHYILGQSYTVLAGFGRPFKLSIETICHVYQPT